jgi:hypothetical protein
MKNCFVGGDSFDGPVNRPTADDFIRVCDGRSADVVDAESVGIEPSAQDDPWPV